MNTTTKTYSHTCQICGTETSRNITPAAAKKHNFTVTCDATECIVAGAEITTRTHAAVMQARREIPRRAPRQATIGGDWGVMGLTLYGKKAL